MRTFPTYSWIFSILHNSFVYSFIENLFVREAKVLHNSLEATSF